MDGKVNKKKIWTGIGAVGVSAVAIVAISSESNYIDIEENFTFDCNAIYNETNNVIQCTEREISGKYSARDNVKLMSGETELTSSDGNFSKKIVVPIIPASEFESYTDISIYALENKYGETKEQFVLFEDDNQKLSKEVAIEWTLSSDDKKLLDSKQDEWKKKRDDEKKAAEQNVVESTTTITTPMPSEQQSSGSSSTNYSPDSGVDYIVEGYCNDGTLVKGNPSAKGKANKCYGHDGWRDY